MYRSSDQENFYNPSLDPHSSNVESELEALDYNDMRGHHHHKKEKCEKKECNKCPHFMPAAVEMPIMYAQPNQMYPSMVSPAEMQKNPNPSPSMVSPAEMQPAQKPGMVSPAQMGSNPMSSDDPPPMPMMQGYYSPYGNPYQMGYYMPYYPPYYPPYYHPYYHHHYYHHRRPYPYYY